MTEPELVERILELESRVAELESRLPRKRRLNPGRCRWVTFEGERVFVPGCYSNLYWENTDRCVCKRHLDDCPPPSLRAVDGGVGTGASPFRVAAAFFRFPGIIQR